jgi:uncharacterized protein YuzE
MGLHLHYDPEVDIAMISFEDGRARSKRHSWGLIDSHPDDGHLMGFEIWERRRSSPPRWSPRFRSRASPTA